MVLDIRGLMMSTAPSTYRQFWPHYVRAHTRPATQRAHLAGTLLGTACAVAGMTTGQWVLVPLSAVLAVAIAVPSHFLFEGNKPSLTQYSFFWSAIADLHMCGLLLAGRMGQETARVMNMSIRPEMPGAQVDKLVGAVAAAHE